MASNLKGVPSVIKPVGEDLCRPEHVEANCAVSDGKPLPPVTLVALRAHAWPRTFYH